MESTINKEAETPKKHRKDSPKQCEFITDDPGLSGGRHKIVLKLIQLIKHAYIQVYKVLLSWFSCFIRKKPPKTDTCRRCQRRNWISLSCRKCRKRTRVFTNLESSYFRSEQLSIHEVQYQPNTFGKQYLSVNESFMSNADLDRDGDSSNFRNLHRTEIYSFGSPTIPKERNMLECFWLREADRIVSERSNPRKIAKRINAQSDPDYWANTPPVTPQQTPEFSVANLTVPKDSSTLPINETCNCHRFTSHKFLSISQVFYLNGKKN